MTSPSCALCSVCVCVSLSLPKVSLFKTHVTEELSSMKKSLAELRSLLIDNLPHDYPEAAS